MSTVQTRFFFKDWNRNFERSASLVRFNQRERTVMAFNNRFGNCQSQARTRRGFFPPSGFLERIVRKPAPELLPKYRGRYRLPNKPSAAHAWKAQSLYFRPAA